MRVKPGFMGSTRKLPTLLLVFGVWYASGCAATPNLSVQMYHPKTKVVQNCTARESTAKDIPLLSTAVEACARQLEARGFIRVESSLTPSEQSNRWPADCGKHPASRAANSCRRSGRKVNLASVEYFL